MGNKGDRGNMGNKGNKGNMGNTTLHQFSHIFNTNISLIPLFPITHFQIIL